MTATAILPKTTPSTERCYTTTPDTLAKMKAATDAEGAVAITMGHDTWRFRFTSEHDGGHGSTILLGKILDRDGYDEAWVLFDHQGYLDKVGMAPFDE